MRIGLFIPCYVDQLYPHVGLATVDVLERYGADVEFPDQQTCCGQPMANTGCLAEAKPLAERFVRIFAPYDYVVAPSGSCVAMVRHHYEHLVDDKQALAQVAGKTFEFCEFLTDVLQVSPPRGSFPFRVGLHQGCHGLRELRMGKPSETVGPQFGKMKSLLSGLDGIQFGELKRPDECCGFGGTFAVSEEAVSCMMGDDRLADHEQAEVQVLTSADMSCLMHLEGLLRRKKKPMTVMHVAEILAGKQPD